MKRTLLSIGLLILNISTAFGMQNREELHEPSDWTRTQVEHALNAFEIPLETIKIYGFKKENARSGYCNSIEKFIAMNEHGSTIR